MKGNASTGGESSANGSQPQCSATQQEEERAAEAALVAQAQRDPQAFGELYERYIDRIYSYVYSRVQNVQDAEDLTARIFYRALDRLDRYEDRGLPFGAWLFRIAHNLVANWHRDQSRRTFLPIDGLVFPGERRDEPEATVERREGEEALWAAIERLPEERRRLLLHKFGDQLTNLEIGELMQKSEGAIKSLYFRTLAALRKDLGEQLDDDGASPVPEAEKGGGTNGDRE
ncbi:MAG: sigma-70 family RNA polymerase sigma factor [Caldilineaceae bacterium]|nr:sigma-70 family RNA polymerase sigma factor [Caldilineaceae bacterium]